MKKDIDKLVAVLIIGILVLIVLFYILIRNNLNYNKDIVDEDYTLVKEKEDITANSTKEFYLNSFDSLFSKNSDNLVYSPYSEKLCLILGLYGMNTESKAFSELSNCMGYKTSDLSSIYSDIEFSKSSLDEKDDIIVSNSIWHDLKISSIENSKYTSDMKEKFDAEVFPSDLTSNDFVKEVNSYVSDKTNKMITKLMDKPLTDDSKLMLMNVLYMDAEWKNKFKSSDTFPDNFNGNEYQEMMHQEAYLEYARRNNLEMLKLPYTNGLEMVLIKPVSDEESIDSIWSSLYPFEKEDLIDGISLEYNSDTKVRLTLPKFEVSSKLDLKSSLQSLGVHDMFSDDLSSFSNITDEYPLYVSDIIQTAKLKCDEDGTEAAAVTQMMFENCSAVIEEEEIIDYNVNKPFIYVIRDTNSNEWLFMGYVGSLD